MAALTAERDTKVTETDMLGNLPVAANVILYAGALIASNAAGYAVPGAAATGLVAAGRCEQTVDNRNGAAGDKKVNLRRGVFLYANSAGGDAITIADRYKQCFIVDDQTVARTDAGATRSRAGIIMGVEPAGVWVAISPLYRSV